MSGNAGSVTAGCGTEVVVGGSAQGNRGVVWAVLALALAASLMTAPPTAAADRPPDEVDPPAPGEGQPLADPSEPDAPPPASTPPQPAFRASSVGWPQPAVEGLAGRDRYATAVKLSQTGWPSTAPAVVLATGEDYPDALAAATLAGVAKGPLLLTPTGSLHPATAEELRRLQPEVVYVVGRLTGSVEAAVTGLGLATERLRGESRYDTAFAIAGRAADLGAETSTVLVASGEGFPDALAATPLAAALRYPILLSPKHSGHARLADQVAALGAERTLVIGGPGALPDDAVAGLPGLERLAGADRTTTAAAVATRARTLGLTGPPVIASAANFPDGLAGGVYAGAARRAPLLTTGRAQLATPVMNWLMAHRPPLVSTAGGQAAIGAVAVCQLREGNARPWRCIEEELSRQGFNTGAVDGSVDHQSVWAVYALQKVAGLPVDGRYTDREWAAMLRHPQLPVRRPDLGPDHIEIDLARQLVLLVRGGRVAHAFHTSSGKPSTPTIRGTFSVYEKRDTRQANGMYRSIFFIRGYAIHGYPSIPLHPASNGCLRLYDGDADFVFPRVQMGERVHVF
ncbi:MAG TPA: cell wall-binding repeat-containing protein [Egibacteraceae bacterium]|nr:cell wall-binding repeat-containing protein [Egibacteraceae bacterium]